MKKETLILLAVAGVAGYYMYKQSQKSKPLVSVQSPEIITEPQFETKESSLIDTPVFKAAGNLFKTVASKIKAKKEKKQLIKLQSATAATKPKKIKRPKRSKVAGFSDIAFV